MRRALLLAGLYVLVTACAASTDAAGGGDRPDSFGAVVREFQAMGEDPSLYTKRFSDFQLVVQECMAIEGFVFTPAPVPSADEFLSALQPPGYGLIAMTIEQAQTDGLGFVPPDFDSLMPSPFEPPETDGDPGVVSSEEFRWVGAMQGPVTDADNSEPGGCYAQAVSQVGPLSIAESVEFMDQSAELNRFLAMIGDRRAVDVATRWQDCMIALSHASIGDPFNLEGLRTYFFRDLVPEILGEQVEPFDLSGEQRSELLKVERDFTVDLVECALPIRPTLSDLWQEYLGYTPKAT